MTIRRVVLCFGVLLALGGCTALAARTSVPGLPLVAALGVAFGFADAVSAGFGLSGVLVEPAVRNAVSF
jgi:hypothetical protein